MGSFGLAALGYIAGMVVVPSLLRWAALLHTTLGRQGGDFLGPPKRRLLWAVPLVLLVHPAPYLLAGTVIIVVLAVRGRISREWVWPLVGLCTYALFMGMIVARTVRTRKRTARNV